MHKTARVLLPLQKLFPLTYLIPDEIYPVIKGELVIVPFKSKEYTGIIWDFEVTDKILNLKSIKSKFSPQIFLPLTILELISRAANYYLVDLGSIAKLVLPIEIFNNKWKIEKQHIPESFNLFTLSDMQYQILKEIELISKPVVLKGLTGSGKTEIYFNLIAKYLLTGYQCLIMLPEISLTTQIVKRFISRFGFQPVIWNSSISLSQKKLALRGILSGDVKIVIGARSSLFLPYTKLGVIVVDEEHDAAYKQEDNILYNARDMAILKANIEQIKILLCSATPSIETIYNVKLQKYHLIELMQRYKNSSLPEVQLIDMRKNNSSLSKWISTQLISAIKHNLENNEQILLFLNRRGYSPLLLCQQCGYRFTCNHCTSWLVLHKLTNCLECHHCGLKTKIPTICPECLTADKILPCGPGIERIAEEIEKLFPNAKIAIISKDESLKKGYIENLLHQMENGEIEILIGTQIISKGYHFPNLTLVGVIDSDLGINELDLKASEKTFHLLYQVGGRAGRENKKGYLLLQTYQPENTIFKCLINHDYDGFIEYELDNRKNYEMPPIKKMAIITFTGKNQEQLFFEAKKAASFAPKCEAKILGPAKGLVTKIAGNFKYKILVITDKKFPLQNYLNTWTKLLKIPYSIKLKIDIDPINFS